MSRDYALERALRAFRTSYAAREAHTLRELTRAYERTAQRIRERIEALTRRIDADDPARMLRFERYRLQQLHEQIIRELYRYADLVEDAVTEARIQAAILGASHAEGVTRTMLLANLKGVDLALRLTSSVLETEVVRNSVYVPWSRLPKEAYLELAARLAENAPTGIILRERYVTYALDIQDRLLSGLAQGHHPTKIARAMNQVWERPRWEAERVARTEVISAYREANRLAMLENSNVVGAWVWYASVGTCCGGCLGMHGTEHPITETLSSHPSCRCQMIPIPTPWRQLGIDLDSDMQGFGAEQRSRAQHVLDTSELDTLSKRFGPGKARLIAEGRVNAPDLTAETFSTVWGVQRREATLGELTQRVRVA